MKGKLMEIVNHEEEEDELKSSADLALDAQNDVESDEEVKKSLAQTPLDEALANAREALNVATIAIQSASQMTTHILAMEELLLSKGIITVQEFRAQLDHLAQQAKELSSKQVENIIKQAGGLSPNDTAEGATSV